VSHPKSDGLKRFLPPVGAWFRDTYGSPTPPQILGWPSIAAGRHTLIVAPTGSGKTLAAFLACLDHLWRRPAAPSGVGLLYVSPLKALNDDIARNLEFPLSGIQDVAKKAAHPLRSLRVAVRTGDTPAAERQRMLRRHPDILITTPESLHLLLTSRAREILRNISHVIVDEIHALAPNKRGVFLGLLLERLEALNPSSFVRIGLSATQRPLDEVARYLGGHAPVGPGRFEPRPVTIIDAGRRKDLDLEVSLPGRVSPQVSIWPAIEARVQSLIEAHRSTIVFVNNRRVAERLTSRVSESLSAVTTGLDAPPIVTAHHGSLSLDRRRATEELLKAGELRAVVATASLELGIDMGAVDLVCQVESPGSIARGLQRVGRAGHLVGRTSKGRILAKTSMDLLESAALTHEMAAGCVEAVKVPVGCLDVLAQQVVACVAMEPWDVPRLLDLVRGADSFRNLTPAAFESVLELVTGRYHVETFRDLRPRVSWDRVHNRLLPLPGTARLALVSGGTIPDTGQFPTYLGEGGPRLGELDEEFVLERRVGETFVLGSSTWTITAIDPHRVLVAPAVGHSAQMPFWRGEAAHRTAELGEAVGALCRELARRIDEPDVLTWLRQDYFLDEPSARALRDLIARQLRQSGAVPDDRTVLVEAFRDPAGELGLAVLTPFGGRLHHALKLVLRSVLRQRLGITVSGLHGDDGVLLRLPQMEGPPLDLFRDLDGEDAERRLVAELGESALFGLRFRQNAGRAMLLPRPDPAKRTPLWLQRLRARDLLQAVRQMPDFPIVVETFRECLDQDLDLPRLRTLLDQIAAGEVRVVTRRGEIPSPFTSGLVFEFSRQFLYEWDEPKPATAGARPEAVTEALLDSLRDPETYQPWLDPAALGRVEGRLRGAGRPPRTVDEMAERLRQLGDLAPSELSGPMAGFLEELRAQDRATTIELPGTSEPLRWIGTEERSLYDQAFPASGTPPPCPRGGLAGIVSRFLRTRALVDLDEITARYPIDPLEAGELLESWTMGGTLVRIESEGGGPARWGDRRNLDEVRRVSVALKRRESVAVLPEIFADFVARRQHVHPETRLEGSTALPMILDRLAGFAATPEAWESVILPRRVRDYRPSWLDVALAAGWTWRACGDRVGFSRRGYSLKLGPDPVDESSSGIGALDRRVLDTLARRGPSYLDELARELGEPPSQIWGSLEVLATIGAVTNDRFDPLRPTARARLERLVAALPRANGGSRLRPSLRSITSPIPEGRWSRTEGACEPSETNLLARCAVLLERYGVLCRETSELDPWSLHWRELAPVLAAAELRGEVRRGYFVEGLSGVQYALPETVDELARLAGGSPAVAPAVLLNSLDPANLYGSGAPLDVPLLEGGTARLIRNASSELVLIAGRPVLIIEAQGRRLTGLASASEADLKAALALLPSLLGPARRVLKIETYNLAPALSGPAAPWLADLGFVRDPPGMALYAGW
jgi:ATP-dependent Lhr-like helicase